MLAVPDTILTNKIKHSTLDDGNVWDRIYSGKMDYDLLILGSSRAYLHYDPRIIDSALSTNCYNLGRNGKKIDISLLTYDIYTEHNPAPRLVIVDIHSLSVEKSNPYHKQQFYPYLFKKEIYKNIHETHRIRQSDRLIPMLKYRGSVKSILNSLKNTNIIYKGYYGNDRNWDGSQLEHIDTIHYSHDSSVIKQTEQWLEKCKQDGVSVIFVHSPIYI